MLTACLVCLATAAYASVAYSSTAASPSLKNLAAEENTQLQNALNAGFDADFFTNTLEEEYATIADVTAYLARLDTEIAALDARLAELALAETVALTRLSASDLRIEAIQQKKEQSAAQLIEVVLLLESHSSLFSKEIDPLFFLVSPLSLDALILSVEGNSATLSAFNAYVQALSSFEQELVEEKAQQAELSARLQAAKAETATIQNDQKNIRTQKLTVRAFSQQNAASFEELKKESLAQQQQASLEALRLSRQLALFGGTENTTTPTLAWPALPTGGLTALFMEPSYEKVIGIPHTGLDIRLQQGSNVAAAAPGTVLEAVDNGYGYSYISVAHAEGLITVYGHLTSFAVQSGDTVRAGDVIGTSGGRPGTPGAGYLSTGPHLHFEVISNGIQVDPLLFLSKAGVVY